MNKNIKRRAISALLSITSTAFAGSTVSAADTSEADALVTAVVSLAGNAVLESDAAVKMGAEKYNATAEAKAAASELSEKQDAVMREIQDIYPNAEKGFSYTHTFNGFSVTVREQDIDKIKKIDSVENVTVSRKKEKNQGNDEDISLAQTQTPEPELLSCCEEIGADYMHENGIDGEGMVIAIIDSVFDVNHEIFSGEVENPKYSKSDIKNLIEENDLNVSVSANQVYRSEKIPYAYNYASNSGEVYDASGIHGTHVAGIAAGNSGTQPDGTKFESMAPQAQLVLMATSDQGDSSLNNDAVLAAVDDAAKLGVDAVNMSIGIGIYYTPLDEAVNTAANAGIIISCSAGNEGMQYYSADNPEYAMIYSPGSATYSTAVASSSAEKYWSETASFKVGDETVDFAEFETTPLFSEVFSSGEYEYVYCGGGTSDEYADKDVNGKIVVLDRGGSILEAKNHGAIGLILINTETQNLTGSALSDDLKDLIPICCVSYDDGQKLIAAEDKRISDISQKTASIKDSLDTEMSYFSSWGAIYNLDLKPEITTPGGVIYSSVTDDAYDNASGTSMAAPHLTGAAALMYQYIEENYSGRYDDLGIRAFAENLMMSGAAIIYNEDGTAVSPRLQGAGKLNLETSAKIPVYLVGDNSNGKSKINLGDLGENRTFTISFDANNFTDSTVTYDKMEFLCQTDGTETPESPVKLAAVSSNIPESVTVPANGTAKVSFEVTLDEAAVAENMETFTNGFWVDGFVTLSSSADDVPEISIPYTGFYGGWMNAPLLDKSYFDESSYSKETGLCDSDNNLLGGNTIAENCTDLSDEEKEQYNSESFAGISANDTLEVCVFPLRAIEEAIYVTLKKADSGEVVFKDEDSKLGNLNYTNFEQLSGKVSLTTLEDGDYIAEATVTAAYDGETKDTVAMKFYIDTEKPKILSRSVTEENGRTILNMSLSDNRYLMGVTAQDTDSEVSEPIKALSEANVSLDITGMDNPKITVYDYARNSVATTAYDSIEIVPEASVIVSKNAVTITADVTNSSLSETGGDIIAAVYDSQGKLEGIDVVHDDNIEFGTGKYTFTLNIGNNPDDTVKFFIWDSLGKMQPLSGGSEYRIGDIGADI